MDNEIAPQLDAADVEAAFAAMDDTASPSTPAAVEPAPAPAQEMPAESAPANAEAAGAAALEVAAVEGSNNAPAAPVTQAAPDMSAVAAPAAQPAPTLGVDPEALAAAIAKVMTAQAPKEPAQPVFSPKGPEDFLDKEAKDFLANYDKNWDEVAKGEAIRRDAAIKFAIHTVYREVEKYLAPIIDAVNQSQVVSHVSALERAHPDYRELVPEVQGWVAKQSALTRPLYEGILEKGNTEQLSQLFSDFKLATGKTGAAPVSPASSASLGSATAGVPAVTEAPAPAGNDARARAAAVTAPIQGKRSAAPTSKDPSDFTGAFMDAVKTLQ